MGEAQDVDPAAGVLGAEQVMDDVSVSVSVAESLACKLSWVQFRRVEKSGRVHSEKRSCYYNTQHAQVVHR